MLLFPSFAAGLAALQECARAGFMPSLARLSDEMETELIFAAKPPSRGWKGALQRAMLAMLGRRGCGTPDLVVAPEAMRQDGDGDAAGADDDGFGVAGGAGLRNPPHRPGQ